MSINRYEPGGFIPMSVSSPCCVWWGEGLPHLSVRDFLDQWIRFRLVLGRELNYLSLGMWGQSSAICSLHQVLIHS